MPGEFALGIQRTLRVRHAMHASGFLGADVVVVGILIFGMYHGELKAETVTF